MRARGSKMLWFLNTSLRSAPQYASSSRARPPETRRRSIASAAPNGECRRRAELTNAEKGVTLG